MRLAPDQRHAILQEMGIQTYVSRVSLPGAKASAVGRVAPANVPGHVPQRPATGRAGLMEALPVPVAAPGPAAEESRAPNPLTDTAVQRVASVDTAVAGLFPQSTEIAPAQAAPAQAQAVHFAFAYVPVNEELAVICELPWARSAALSPSCRQLLADMLKALGAPCEAERLSPMVFSWPLAQASDMPQDAQTARHMLEGFLSRRLKLRAVPHLLVLAEQSAQFLYPVGSPVPESGLQQHPRLAVQVLVTHSLHAMEAVRELKRSTWQALQPLRQALADSASRHQRPQV